MSGAFRNFSGKSHVVRLGYGHSKTPQLSLSTIHREYAALVSLPYYDYVDMILQPRLPMPPEVDPTGIQNAMSKYGINEPQANAILSSLNMSGFSLIQG
jgi:senataxin